MTFYLQILTQSFISANICKNNLNISPSFDYLCSRFATGACLNAVEHTNLNKLPD